MQRVFLKTKLLIAALIAFGFMAGTVSVRADDEKCEKQIHKAQEQLEKAIRKHGEHSEQAEQKRHKLEEVRERCHHDHDDHDRH